MYPANINLKGRPNRSHKIYTLVWLEAKSSIEYIETAIAIQVSRRQGSPFMDLENQ
jgi:hypothetical protein